MKYLLLINIDPTADPDPEVSAEYGKFTQTIIESGEYLGGEALQGTETATCVRMRDGQAAITDGPFAETKEYLGGYYLVDVKDLDRAIELASQIPGARNGVIEVRPIMDVTG